MKMTEFDEILKEAEIKQKYLENEFLKRKAVFDKEKELKKRNAEINMKLVNDLSKKIKSPSLVSTTDANSNTRSNSNNSNSIITANNSEKERSLSFSSSSRRRQQHVNGNDPHQIQTPLSDHAFYTKRSHDDDDEFETSKSRQNNIKSSYYTQKELDEIRHSNLCTDGKDRQIHDTRSGSSNHPLLVNKQQSQSLSYQPLSVLPTKKLANLSNVSVPSSIKRILNIPSKSRQTQTSSSSSLRNSISFQKGGSIKNFAKTATLWTLNQQKRDLRSIEEIQLDLKRKNEAAHATLPISSSDNVKNETGLLKEMKRNNIEPFLNSKEMKESVKMNKIQSVQLPVDSEKRMKTEYKGTKNISENLHDLNEKNEDFLIIKNGGSCPVNVINVKNLEKRDRLERIERPTSPKNSSPVSKRTSKNPTTCVKKKKLAIIHANDRKLIPACQTVVEKEKNLSSKIGKKTSSSQSEKLSLDNNISNRVKRGSIFYSDEDEEPEGADEEYYNKNYSIIIRKLFKTRCGNNRESDYDGDSSDMESAYGDIRREENESARIAIMEDLQEEKRLKKHLKKSSGR